MSRPIRMFSHAKLADFHCFFFFSWTIFCMTFANASQSNAIKTAKHPAIRITLTIIKLLFLERKITKYFSIPFKWKWRTIVAFLSDAYHRQSTWMKRGPRAFYASLTVITHTDLRTLKCCQCHMWNRYHPWNWAQNNQLTNPGEEGATWPSTGEKQGPWGDFMKRLVASGPGTDDGVEKRTRVGVSWPD